MYYHHANKKIQTKQKYGMKEGENNKTT